MHPIYHAKSSARKFGGVAEDYLDLHNFMDHTKAHIGDARHRMLLHNSWGIFLVERIYGVTFNRLSDGKEMATRPILEQHVIEDLGRIPSVAECFANMPIEEWMFRNVGKVKYGTETNKHGSALLAVQETTSLGESPTDAGHTDNGTNTILLDVRTLHGDSEAGIRAGDANARQGDA